MENKRNILLFVHFLVWALFYVVISGAQENSGDMPYLKSMLDLPSDLVYINNSSIVTENDTNTTLTEKTTMEEMSTLITKLTSVQETTATDQSSTTRDYDTTFTKKLRPTTSSAKTTNKQLTEEIGVSTKIPKTGKRDAERTGLMTRLNGYKIATFCLAAILGILFLIILIYFSAKSKTGHADISCPPPDTPPLDVEDIPNDEEEPKVVRLSSYFPYADNSSSKAELNENGDVDVDERNVTTFLTRKKSLEDPTGSQDKILHTSEL